MRVGFIGVGRMGRLMSQRLAEAGYELVLCDSRREVAAELAQSYRGSAVATPAEIASGCEAAILSLPGPAESEAVIRGAGGLLDAAAPGFLAVDMTTTTLSYSREMAQRTAERGVFYLDAPV